MVNNEYSPDDFRIYIGHQVEALKTETDLMVECVGILADFSDRLSVECAANCLSNSQHFIRGLIAKLQRDLFHDAHGEQFPKQREKLGVEVSRLRRRREREGKQEP